MSEAQSAVFPDRRNPYQNNQNTIGDVFAPGNRRLTHLLGASYSIDVMTLVRIFYQLRNKQEDDFFRRQQNKRVVNIMDLKAEVLELIEFFSDCSLFFVQKGNMSELENHQLYTEFLKGNIVEVPPMSQKDDGLVSFHPKFLLARYESDENNGDSNEDVQYKFCVTSKNLTDSIMMDCFASFSGHVNKAEGDDDFGQDLQSLLERYRSSFVNDSNDVLDHMINELSEVRFHGDPIVEEKELLFSDPDHHRSILPFNSSERPSKLAVFSPSLSPSNNEDLVSEMVDDAQEVEESNYFLFSNKDSLDQKFYAQDAQDEILNNVYFFNSLQLHPGHDSSIEKQDVEGDISKSQMGEDDDLSDESSEENHDTNEEAKISSLHAKMYVTEPQEGEENQLELFLGSANASGQGLRRNHEVIVRLRVNELYEEEGTGAFERFIEDMLYDTEQNDDEEDEGKDIRPIWKQYKVPNERPEDDSLDKKRLIWSLISSTWWADYVDDGSGESGTLEVAFRVHGRKENDFLEHLNVEVPSSELQGRMKRIDNLKNVKTNVFDGLEEEVSEETDNIVLYQVDSIKKTDLRSLISVSFEPEEKENIRHTFFLDFVYGHPCVDDSDKDWRMEQLRREFDFTDWFLYILLKVEGDQANRRKNIKNKVNAEVESNQTSETYSRNKWGRQFPLLDRILKQSSRGGFKERMQDIRENIRDCLHEDSVTDLDGDELKEMKTFLRSLRETLRCLETSSYI